MWVNQSVTYVGELDHHRAHRAHREGVQKTPSVFSVVVFIKVESELHVELKNLGFMILTFSRGFRCRGG